MDQKTLPSYLLRARNKITSLSSTERDRRDVEDRDDVHSVLLTRNDPQQSMVLSQPNREVILLRALNAAISACPNDTYIFEAWALKKIYSGCLDLQLSFHDVETLNLLALTEAPFDLTKLSTACAGAVSKEYIILPVGATFALHRGPFLVGKRKKCALKTIAIPGEHTSAVLAYKLLYGEKVLMRVFPFHEVPHVIQSGICDAGIIIHEVQNCVAAYGLEVLDDIGASFRKKFSFPLPLGVIAMKRSLGKDILEASTRGLFESILYAHKIKDISSFVLDKAQDPSLAKKHIELFVTQETMWMGKKEVEYIKSFFSLAQEASLLNFFRDDLVYGV